LHNWDPIEGFELWDNWSKQDKESYAKNKENYTTQEKWQTFKSNNIQNKLTIGTLIRKVKMIRERKNWKELIPVNNPFNHPKIRTDSLPNKLQDYAKSLARMAEVDETVITMGLFGIISTILSSHYYVSPKPDWRESVNLYTIIALPSANNKTLILRNISQPLKDWEKAKSTEKDLIIEKQKEKLKIWNLQLEYKRKQICKSKTLDEKNHLEREIDRLIDSKPEVDHKIKLFGNNFTSESLLQDLYEQKGKLSLIADEGGLFETLFGLYTGGKTNFDIVLKGIDGGTEKMKRKSCEFHIPEIYLSMVLLVQPAIITKLHNRSSTQGVGLEERFIYLLPKILLGHRKLDDYSIPIGLKLNYDRLCQDLLDIVYSLDEPIKLLLSDTAKSEFYKFRADIEKELGPGGSLSNILGWGGKLCGYVLRFAGLIHVVDNYPIRNQEDNTTISLETMQKAIEIGNILIEHAVYAFGFNTSASKTTDRVVVWLKKILSSSRDRFTQTDLYKEFRIPAKDIKPDLDLLIECNYIKIANYKNDHAKKDTTVYLINPKLKDFK
ncbi:MAG: hypothetical protein P857_763, partial [Candidatus Xenolissoclinum pacificiensis L6]